MNSDRVDLLTNAAAGNGTAKRWKGGKGSFFAEGSFGGGSVKLQAQSPNDTWIDIPNTTHSANGIIDFSLAPGMIRAVAATGSAFYAYAIKYGE